MNDLSKDGVRRIRIGEEDAGQRLDNFLVRILKGVPKSHVYRIVRSGEVRLDGRRARPDTRLTEGAEVRVPPVRTAQRHLPGGPSGESVGPGLRRTAGPLPPVLYEDQAILAVDKPAGMAVHGGSGIAFGVIERLRQARPEARFLELVHRLDRETSGVLLLAKKRSALTHLHAQMREGTVDKRYQVLVRGRWRDAMRRVALPLLSTTQGETRHVRVAAEGKAASTVVRRERVWRDLAPPLSLLEAQLETGRTHQIRVHLAHLGFPLAGDDKYGDFEWNRALAKQGLKRMFLHARRLAFVHPLEGTPVVVESPLPAELVRFVQGLDRASGEVAGDDADTMNDAGGGREITAQEVASVRGDEPDATGEEGSADIEGGRSVEFDARVAGSRQTAQRPSPKGGKSATAKAGTARSGAAKGGKRTPGGSKLQRTQSGRSKRK